MDDSPHIDDREFRALRELSAALGAILRGPQRRGGNTSIKRDGVMGLKASGTGARRRAVRLSSRCSSRRSAQSLAIGIPARAAQLSCRFLRQSQGLRPSSRSSVHAIMP